MTEYSLTLAGLGISLAILGANLRTWWTSPGRDPKTLGPFAYAFALGGLATICAGGLLGWLAGCSAAVTNGTGTRVVSGATGTEGSPLARGTLGTLTPEGGLVVFLLACGVVLAWKAAGKQEKRRMAGGMVCGSTLCLTAGVAGLLNWLPALVNEAGAGLRAAVEGGGIL